MQITLRQAAREAGISKSTLSRAVAAGKVSATRHEDGRLTFDPAEVHRVFPLRPQSADASDDAHRRNGDAMSQDAPGSETGSRDYQSVATALSVAEQRIADLKERLAELKEQCNAWQRQAETLGNRPLMLPVPSETASRRAWWPWRRSA